MKKIAAYSLAMFAPCAAALAAQPTGTEWKEPENLSFGREERRAAFSSFDTLESALKILPEFSERTISLDSETAWKFKWSPDPASRPVGFEKLDYDVSGWETIKVPCSWQAYGANGKGGWGTALYVNQTYPFKRDQPDVMGEPPKDWTSYAARNPVGSYRRDFDVPEKWSGQEIFLKFDAVDSFFYLWVNGEYVGFSKDSRNPAEFNVTKFVKSGKNTVALEVYRYSDGSYLEDQDMFRLSGIARSTWLLARPKTRIRDFTVTPRPVDKDKLDGDWELIVTCDTVPSSRSTSFAGLYDMDDKPVEVESVTLGTTGKFVVKNPKLWSAETPNCYKLVMYPYNDKYSEDGVFLAAGRASEYVSCLVGFRTSEVRDGRYYFNNEKIKFRGVNRSESDPMYGHYVPRERQLQDIRLMKEANINHVRNSHYPEDDYWYYLCDIYGIYVLDEANVESHGYYYGEASLSHRKEWEKATVARNLDMVRRNRNHPSVVFWSLGNEAGPGENFAAASAAIKEMDPSRPIQYERDNSVADVDSNQYPGVDWTVWKSNDHKAKKPFYISEYAHNMCNAMGNLKDYQDAIESSDVILGAAIWDWVDQGLYKKNKDGKMILAYGGDFGDVPNDGQFVMNGVILSDRCLEPGFYEVKIVFQPFDIKFSEDGKKVTVKNLNYFRSGEGYELSTEGFKAKLTMPPRGVQTFDLPECRGADGSEKIGRNVCITLMHDEGLLKKGHIVGGAEFINTKILSDRELLSVKGEVKDASDDKALVFSSTNIMVRFCRESGALVSYERDGKEYLLAPMTVDAFRAPSSNEVGLGDRWAMAGLRELVQKATSISDVTTNPDGSKSFTVVADVRGRQKEHLVGFGGRTRKQAEFVPAGPVAKHDPHFVVAQKWTVFGNGMVACQSEIRSRGRVMELARIGYRFTLDKFLDKVMWAGLGPFENYPDRKSGALNSLWKDSVAEMVERYAKPQDMGNREDTYVVAVGSSQPKHYRFGVTSLDKPFSFSAIPYSPTELALTMHPEELPEIAKTELGIYTAVRGLGGASCGPGPLGRDIVRNNKTFKLDFVIGIPNRGSNKFPSLPPAELPPDVRTGEDIVPTVVACSSAEPGEGDAEHLVDGDLSTIWHSQYGVTLTKYPHSVTVDMGRDLTAKGVSIWQRQNGPNGNVKNFKFEVSEDGKQWREVVASQLKQGAAEQKFTFAAPEKLHYWRFTGLNEHGGREFASLAEISLH
ncbi:MAG: discoidin domain-containing protein [Kiritimatiellae bacterium]|nr:discoidin domain-containing protein [Kiritimatiellia bacterium]